MIILLVALLGATVAYFGLGFAAAAAATPILCRKHYVTFRGYKYPAIKESPIHLREPEVWVEKVKRDQALVVTAWPVYFPALVMAAFLAARIGRYDPNLPKRQAARISELERELGIGDNRWGAGPRRGGWPPGA
jgi:hypothetical protein